jgi:hypothetical protein
MSSQNPNPHPLHPPQRVPHRRPNPKERQKNEPLFTILRIGNDENTFGHGRGGAFF